jgi:molybdenum cofactor guanylyltransferase
MSRNLTRTAPLHGLVLAGGRGSRLKRDKGELDYHGVPQAQWAFELLAGVCALRFVSIRAEQAEVGVYRGLPLIVDGGESRGPASGLRAALRRFPGAAWLVIAADMPLLDSALLATLVAARDAGLLATAYRHADGTPEPLCAIWEPAVLALLEAGGSSLRRLLEAGPAKFLELGVDQSLSSVNTPADDARIRQNLARPAVRGGG